MSVDSALHDDAQALGPGLVQLRRRLHQHPEIGLDLPATQQLVLDALDGLPVEVKLGTSSTSVTAVMRGSSLGRPYSCVETWTPCPSPRSRGRSSTVACLAQMHACGHDLHTAMLLGAVRLLAAP